VAKKDGKKPPEHEAPAASPADAARAAAAQAIDAAAQAGLTRERALGLLDDLAQAAGRIRDAMEELRPPSSDELRALRERIAGLEERVARLEAGDARPKPRRTAPAKRKPAA
jgi:hypothetical protein